MTTFCVLRSTCYVLDAFGRRTQNEERRGCSLYTSIQPGPGGAARIKSCSPSTVCVRLGSARRSSRTPTANCAGARPKGSSSFRSRRGRKWICRPAGASREYQGHSTQDRTQPRAVQWLGGDRGNRLRSDWGNGIGGFIGAPLRAVHIYATALPVNLTGCQVPVWAFLVSLISTHPPDGALSRTSLRPRPRSQRSSASIASSYHDQCTRARNIFILRSARRTMSYSCRRAASGSIRDARLAGT